MFKNLNLQGYDHREAADGRRGVAVFEQEGPFQ